MTYRQAADPAGCGGHVLPWQALGDPSGPCHHFDHDHGRPSDLYGYCDPHHLVDDILARVTDTEVYHVVSGLPDQYRSYLLRILRMDPQENVSPFTAARLRHHFQSVADPRVRVVGSVLLSGPIAEITYNSEGLGAEPLALLVERDPRAALSVLMRWPVLEDDLSAAAVLPLAIRQLGLAAAYAAGAPLGVLALGWLLAESNNLPELLVTAIRAAWRQATHWSPTLPQDPLPIPQCSADARKAHLAYRGRAEAGGGDPPEVAADRGAAHRTEGETREPVSANVPTRETPRPAAGAGSWASRLGGPTTREVSSDVSPNAVTRILSSRLTRRSQQADQEPKDSEQDAAEPAAPSAATTSLSDLSETGPTAATVAVPAPPPMGPPRTDVSRADFSGTDVTQPPRVEEDRAESDSAAPVGAAAIPGSRTPSDGGTGPQEPELGADIGPDGAPRDTAAREAPAREPAAAPSAPGSEPPDGEVVEDMTTPIPAVDGGSEGDDAGRRAGERAGGEARATEWARHRGRAAVPSGPRGWLGPSRSGEAEPAPTDQEPTGRQVPERQVTAREVTERQIPDGVPPEAEHAADGESTPARRPGAFEQTIAVPSPPQSSGAVDPAAFAAEIDDVVGRLPSVRDAMSRAYAALGVEQAPDPADVAALTALADGFGDLSARLTTATGYPVSASVSEFRSAVAELERRGEQERVVVLLERLQGLTGPDALAADISRVRALAVQTADALRTVGGKPARGGASAGESGHDAPDPVTGQNGQPSILDGLVALTELVELVGGTSGGSDGGRRSDVTDPRIAPASTFHRMVELEDTVRAALSDVVRPVLAAAVVGGLRLPEA